MPNKTADDAPQMLPKGAREIYATAFNSAWEGTCSEDDACAARVAWAVVKKKYQKRDDGKWVRKSSADINDGEDATSGAVASFDMYITKASYDREAEQMRFACTASDTEWDLFETRMSLDLFKDFVLRVEEGEPVPEQFRSTYWDGGMPYVSISHHLDLEGWGVAGRAVEVYVDGQAFKTKGIFENPLKPELARAAYDAVKRDIKENVPSDERVRISIAFIDWQHNHGETYRFVRKSLDEVCPLCAAGVRETTFEKGQLIHLALTRVPVNQRTWIELEERSMVKTRKEDAASIVGDELAEELEEQAAAVGRSEVSPAIVVKAEAESETETEPESTPTESTPASPAVAESQTVSTENQGPSAEVRMHYGYDSETGYFGGAKTVSEAVEFTEAMEEVEEILDLWYMFQLVVENLAFYADESATPAQRTADLKAAVKDFASTVENRALVALSTIERRLAMTEQLQQSQPAAPPAPAHTLDGALARVRAAYDEAMADTTLDRNGRLQHIQGALNGLGEAILRNSAAADPVTPDDITKAVEAVLSKYGLVTAPQPTGPQLGGAPVVRALQPQPQPQQNPGATAGANHDSIRAIARRSVGLEA